jgi:hypothetical protein
MDETTPIKIGVAALFAALLIIFYVLRRLRIQQSRRRVGGIFARYFEGDMPLDQLAREAHGAASGRFLGSSECQALVQAAFQRAAEAKLADGTHSLEAEKRLLMALAAAKSEFGLPERYQSEGWKSGRE